MTVRNLLLGIGRTGTDLARPLRSALGPLHEDPLAVRAREIIDDIAKHGECDRKFPLIVADPRLVPHVADLISDMNEDVVTSASLAILHIATEHSEIPIAPVLPKVARGLLYANRFGGDSSVRSFTAEAIQQAARNGENVSRVVGILRDAMVTNATYTSGFYSTACARALTQHYFNRRDLQRISELLNDKRDCIRNGAAEGLAAIALDGADIAFAIPRLQGLVEAHRHDRNVDETRSARNAASALTQHYMNTHEQDKIERMLDLREHFPEIVHAVALALANAAERKKDISALVEPLGALLLSREPISYSENCRFSAGLALGRAADNGVDLSSVVPTLKSALLTRLREANEYERAAYALFRHLVNQGDIKAVADFAVGNGVITYYTIRNALHDAGVEVRLRLESDERFLGQDRQE